MRYKSIDRSVPGPDDRTVRDVGQGLIGGRVVFVLKCRAASIALCLGLGACAQAGPANPLSSVYGAFEKDGTVDLPIRGVSREFNIRLGKTEPKINVQMSVMGTVNLSVFGTVGFVDDPAPELFERAANTYLKAKKSSACRVSQPVRIGRTEWEFDYDCPAPPPTAR